MHYPTEGYRSKSWDEFAIEDARTLGFVFTVCDDAAGEVCPAWPGQPITTYWGVPDPAAAPPEAQERAFGDAFFSLQRGIGFIPVLAAQTDEPSNQAT
jgi:protein-tyrosine-phosphatase